MVTKGVTLKGPTSGEPAIISNPGDSSAVSIRADNVTLSWLTIESPGLGVYMEDVDTVNLRVLTLDQTGDIPVRVKGATNVLLQSSTFTDREGSMVFVDDGGSIRVVNCLFDRIAGYATAATAGGILSLEGNEFLDNAADSRKRPPRAPMARPRSTAVATSTATASAQRSGPLTRRCRASTTPSREDARRVCIRREPDDE